jgi:hypothetical protein
MTLLEAIHGHIGVLAMAALFHPTLLLWSGKPLSRNAKIALAASLTLVATAFTLGLTIYPAYREEVKPELFQTNVLAGVLFDTKEHLAWIALVGAVGAGIAGLVAPPKAAQVRRIAGRVFLGAAIACTLVVGLGTWIASVRGFE